MNCYSEQRCAGKESACAMDNSTGVVWGGEFLAQEPVLALPVSRFMSCSGFGG